MLKIIILTISTINFIGCAKATPLFVISHPDLVTPNTPDLPKYTRKMVNCGKDDSVLDLCNRILLRETTLKDHIETLEDLIGDHNRLLKIEPESGN